MRSLKETALAAWRERPRGRGWLFFLGGLLLLAALALTFERRIEAHCPGAAGRWGHAAEELSYWGDFPTGTLILSLGLLAVGAAARKEAWRRIGWAIVLAAVVAGAPALTVRFLAGRPRPTATWAGIHDGFYGPHRREAFHSFPSGHAATSFATAGALGAAVPPLMPAALAGATAVCWSRAYLRRHHLSDLIAGAGWGLLVGLHFGRIVRKRNSSASRPS